MDDGDLRNADFSHLRVQDMTAEQRAEMRRRYAEFVRRVVRRPAVEQGKPAKPRRVAKWVPGRRAG
jgi:hypothetical protein